MKQSNFLKVASIIMIVGAALGIITGAIFLAGVGLLGALLEAHDSMALLYASGALIIVASAIQLIAGIIGLKACKQPEKAKTCIIWGIIIVVLSVASIILSLAAGGDFNITNTILNFVVPVLYIVGAVQLNNAYQANQNTF